MSFLDERLCVQLYIRVRQITRCHEMHLKPLGVTYPQALTLLALDEKGPCCIDVIGRKLCLDIGTLSPLLKKMEKGGWIHRERDQQDERRVLVRLSEHGQSLIPPIKASFMAVAEKACLPASVVQEIIGYLNMVRIED